MYLFHSAKNLGARWTGLLGIISLLAPANLSAAELLSPSQAAVNAAISCQLISYNRSFSGGAHTNGAWFGGASIALAVASYAGNTSADARLLAQIRHTLTPGNEPTLNGGYPAQHERHVTTMFVIAKNTPRIWDQLTVAEKARIDLIEKAALVADAFTTSDNNPFIKANGTEYALDGDDNLNRDWNPNYREGMIGGVVNGVAYFGSAGAAQTFLSNYSHSAFVAELSANNLPNIYETFNWKTANSTSKAPSGSQIETGVRSYKYYGSTLADYMKIYEALLNDTYGKTVNAGLNNGAGISGAGKIVSGADTLPNKGATGMLKEFESSDANGARSSFVYAFDGYRPHMSNQIALIVSGLWTKGSAVATKAASRMNVGNTDLWYKAEKGYIGYAKGKAQATVDYPSYSGSRGFAYNRSLWDDVLKPFHGLGSGNPNPDPDPEPEPTPLYPAGTRVTTDAVASVRATASGTGSVVGSMALGSFGTVLAGPTTADSVEWWQVYFDNGLTGWVDVEQIAAAPASEFLTTVNGEWQNRTISAQTGTFTISFNMRPAAANIDALTGVSTSAASAFGNVAAVVRFATTGNVDARNGGAYAAANVFPYQAGVTYRVQMTVNVATRTYSATVAAPGGSPVTIANSYAFRSEQASATSLANLAVFAQTGSHTTSGIVIQGAGTPTPPSAPTGLRIVENQ
ncbi:hypothetical protein [Haloferula sp. BvORR071]|uniref:hypothetical protein n=1 Tax=Haloferula sp. BvORR071 TaxID=1396141 RepID=UPI000698E2A0|nr:hypothetical protein [Haloferula sp. BvORR071]